ELVEISISRRTINEVSIQVNRLGGESILEEKLSFNTFTLNTSQWVSGVYIVSLSAKEGWRIIKKIVKL
ncbi:MAG: T9SS type A sorting domain-containing protein, partial [Bacteroidota bacterium]